MRWYLILGLVLLLIANVPSSSAADLDGATCFMVEGANQLLCRSANQEPLALTWTMHSNDDGSRALSYLVEEGDHTVLSLGVVSTVDSLEVLASADGFTASWRIVDESSPAPTAELHWNDHVLILRFSEDGEPAMMVGDLAAYHEAIAWSGEMWRLKTLADLASRLPQNAPLAKIALAAVAGLTVSQQPRSPIGDLFDCWKDTCARCNGCWDGGCGPCNGDPWWAKATIYACYSAGALLCEAAVAKEAILDIELDGSLNHH